MATAAKQTGSVRGSPPASSPVATPTSPNNNNNNLTSPGHITSYKKSQTGKAAFVDGSQEDIATIAKQISDHAEAIYQTWKARGLAPTEILNIDSAAASFMSKSSTSSLPSSPVVNELLAPDMSNNNNLEKLVNSFVSEDKARIAAARSSLGGSKSASPSSPTSPIGSSAKSIISGSSGRLAAPTGPSAKQLSDVNSGNNCLPNLSSVSVIKQTLQKFEANNNNNNSSVKNFNLAKPKQGISSTSSPSSAKIINTNASAIASSISNGGNSISTQPLLLNGSSSLGGGDRNNNSDDLTLINKKILKKNLLNHNDDQNRSDSSKSASSILLNNVNNSSNNSGSNKKKICSNNNNVPDVLLDTIIDKASVKPQTPVKPASLLNHVPSWPLKNRVSISSSVLTLGGDPHQPTLGNNNESSSSAAVLISRDEMDDSGRVTTTTTTKVITKTVKSKMKSKVLDGSESASGSDSGSSDQLAVVTPKKKVLSKKSPSNSAIKPHSQTVPSAADLMDEVTREEERLINALKTGEVLKNSNNNMSIKNNNNNNSSSSASSEKSLPIEVVVMSSAVSESGHLNDGDTNFELSSAVAGHPPSNSAHHIPKLWHNDENQNPQMQPQMASITSTTAKIIKTRTLRSAMADTAMPQQPDQSQNKGPKGEKGSALNPIRPFLTRGSVAERVLIFERCPEIKAPPRMTPKEPNRLQVCI